MTRIIQWGTGQCGKMAMQTVLERPDLELVGARVFDPEKAGRDLGELCGLGPIGVTASDDEAEVLALDADCVLWMGDVFSTVSDDSTPGLCRILASGKSVISIVHTWFMTPAASPAELDQLEAACREGGSTFYATGMEPGFVNEVLTPVLTSLCRRIDFIEMRELLNYADWQSPMLFTLMPFGREPDEHVMSFVDLMTPFFAPNMQLVADAVGIKIDEIRTSHDVALSPDDFDVRMGHVAAGTIGAIRFAWTGYVDGVPRIKTEHINRLRDDLAPEWIDRGVDGHGYDVRVEGDPSFYVNLDFALSDRTAVQTALLTTAMRAVNSIPFVCAAPPGVATAATLAQISGRGSMAHLASPQPSRMG